MLFFLVKGGHFSPEGYDLLHILFLKYSIGCHAEFGGGGCPEFHHCLNGIFI